MFRLTCRLNPAPLFKSTQIPLACSAAPALRYLFAEEKQAFKPAVNQAWNNPTAEELKTSAFVAKNVGVSKFLTRTYNTTACAVVGALTGTYVATSIPLFMANPMMTIIGGGLLALASFFGVNRIAPNIISEGPANSPIYRTENPAHRLALYGLGVLSLGVSASPLFMAIQALNASIIPSAIAVTSGIFGGASMMAYMMPKDKMIGYGRILMGSLFGLIGLQLVGLGAGLLMGPNLLSSLLFTMDNYLGILLFSGLIAYDTHVAIKQYEMGLADHLGMSVQLLLNFWNILIRVMSIMSRRD